MGIKPEFNLLQNVILAHKNMLYLAMLCLILGTVIDVGLVVVIKQLLDGVKDHTWYTTGNNPLFIALLVMAAVCLRELIAVFQNNRLAILTYNIGASLKRKLVIAHRSLKFERLLHISKNDILSLFRNVDDIVDFTRQGLVVTIREAMTLLGTVIVMLYLNFTLALAFLLLAPIAIKIVKAMASISKKSAEKSLIARNSLNQHVIHGHENWIAFYINRLARDDYFNKLSKLLASYKSNGIALTMAAVWLSMLTQFCVGIMLSIIIYLMLTGSLGATIGTMAAFLYAVARLRSPSKRIADLRSIYDQALASAAAIYEFINAAPSGKHCRQAKAIIWSKISLIDVCSKVLATPINIELSLGEKYLLSGISGVGKTTLLHMFALLIKPNSGVIKIDELPLTESMQESWFESMVYIEQFSTLLSASMRENLTAFASANDEMCTKVLKIAGLELWLDKNGLDTKIGDGGVPLSGGEQQRVILARIMLQCTGKTVVLLDEVLTAIDADSGYDLMAILLEYLQNSLVIAVSHRSDTYNLFDKILVLDKQHGLKEITHEKFAEKINRIHDNEHTTSMVEA